jgi:ATP-dependent DNA ligase
MQITRESFVDLKPIDNTRAQELVNDNNKIFERKYDGTAGIINVDIETEEFKIFGRGILKDGSQQEYTDTFPDLLPSVKTFCDKLDFLADVRNITLLGEIVVLDPEGNESFKGVESRCNRKKDIDLYAKKFPAQFMVFDALSLNGDLKCLSFQARRQELEGHKDVIEESDRLRLIEQRLYPIGKQDLLDRVNSGKYGYEGIVVKDLRNNYFEPALKYKYKCTEDVFWEGDYKEGKGKHEGRVGSLVCYQYINGKKLEVAQVGGGLTDSLRDELMQMVENGEVSAENPRTLEVQTHELLPSGKMRYPNFIRWRFDKSAGQCTRCLKQPEEIKPVAQKVKQDLSSWF